MILKWEDDFEIKVSTDNNTVLISANKEGLISLSNHLLAMAEENGAQHIHLDEYNSLEDGSAELIIEKTE